MGPKATSSTTRTIFRDSDTGRITTQHYAEKHPKTTEKERVRVPAPAPEPRRTKP